MPISDEDGPDGAASSSDRLLASQIAYYRAHAPRYDDWWYRRGRHDVGAAYRESWSAQIEALRAQLVGFAPLGDVLEFAGGTGNWTQELAKLAASVTVLDASPEAVAIAKEKVAGNVTWLIRDVFEYRPDRSYDTIFFGFWLSHVPLDRFERFWQLVGNCLKPDGRVFFIDNAHPELAQAVAPDLFSSDKWRVEETSVEGVDSVTDLKTGVSTRLAADGRSYTLAKIWWEPEELRSRLAQLGWTMQIATTEWAFLYGVGSRART